MLRRKKKEKEIKKKWLANYVLALKITNLISINSIQEMNLVKKVSSFKWIKKVDQELLIYILFIIYLFTRQLLFLKQTAKTC
jgi:hypothetical protein